MSYSEFLKTKTITARAVGRQIAPNPLHGSLFKFQIDIIRWAIHRGRGAIFADTGLGKTAMQLSWASNAADRVIILAPLAVAAQTVREGARIGIPVTYARRQEDAAPTGITITNYEMLDRFDTDAFDGVVLDESSILKSQDSKTRARLIDAFRETPARLACTATPAPNDIAEIANHSEFLGVMSRAEMMASFFIQDRKTMEYRLKGHGRDHFYRWLASWGMAIKRPSDLGYDDAGYTLPGLAIDPIFIEVGYAPEGQLFATELKGVGDRARVRRETLAARVAATVERVNAEPDEPWIVWCGLNDEASAIVAGIPGSVDIRGSMSSEAKSAAMMGFSEGRIRVIVTKPSICGFGMNWQHCARMVFCGLSDSYEAYYQCIRRCYRFGQKRPVTAYVVLSTLERAIHENVMAKERESDSTGREMVKHIGAHYENPQSLAYAPAGRMEIPSWLSV